MSPKLVGFTALVRFYSIHVTAIMLVKYMGADIDYEVEIDYCLN